MSENIDHQSSNGHDSDPGPADGPGHRRTVARSRAGRAPGTDDANSGHRDRPRRGGTDGVPGTVQGFELGQLLPSTSQDLARTVSLDEDFAREFPRAWTVLSCQRTTKGKPRCPAEIVVRADGAVFTAILTCPEEMLVLGVEFELLSDLWVSLEARLSQEPIPWRKAGKHVRRKQLSPEKGGGQNQG